MSSLIVEVTEIDNLVSHPQADRLEVATVKGWQICVDKGKHQIGDKVVYFPMDSMLPLELADRFNVRQHLGTRPSWDRGRVRCAKLRGVPSFGMVQFPDDPSWEIGTDVKEHYNVTKYEPPRKLGNDELPNDPLFWKYTDIENMRNFPSIFIEGEPVIITEKIHGMTCRVGIIEGEKMAGSNSIQRLAPPEENYTRSRYWFPFSLTEVSNLLNALSAIHRQVILFGEIYGKGIQTMDYGQVKVQFRAFDIIIDGRYLDFIDFKHLCEYYHVDIAPILAENVPFSLENVVQYSRGKTTLDAEHIREGVVVRPMLERQDLELGRVILKYLNDSYLFSKYFEEEEGSV